MLDRQSPTNTPPADKQLPPTLLPTHGKRWAAKFPPDDDGLPPGPGIPAGGGASDDGNFKRGRFKPVAIVVALLIAVGGAGAVYLGAKSEGDKMTQEAISKEKKNIFVLPAKDQTPLWRKWAATPGEPNLQQEALIQLAWADDPEGVALATKAIQGSDHRVRGVAAQALAHFGPGKADGAKPALLEALKTADDSDKPQIIWALVALKEPAVFKDAMDQYRAGFLSKVERLGGGAAFDPEMLAKLVSLQELSGLAGDPSASVRQLVATVLSRDAKPEWTDVLVRLVKDKDPEVGREAANGLGKIADDKARGPLLEALQNADKDSRQKFLEALRDGIGGEGLVLALDSVDTKTEQSEWFQTKQIMEMLRELADPRSGDAIMKWFDKKKPKMHWEGEAGTRLAEIGDVRGAKLLGDRLRVDPSQLYQQSKFWEADAGGHLSRTDLPRVVATRMLADLAQIHPEAKADLKDAAEDPVLKWSKDKPQPHANGLRFLAIIGSEKALPDMRDWAFPKKELPKEGAQPPFASEFETAQSALRYIGRMKDEPSFPKLLDQLKRKKDKKMDITQAGLEGAGLAMLGMALRAVAYGASQGLAEWGDGRAVKPLEDFIEDETWHEEARQAACEALAWCADEKAMADVAKKVKEFGSKKDPKKQLIGACYASALALKAVPAASSDLVDLLTPEADIAVRAVYAKAIGVAGFDAATEAKLFEKMKSVDTRNAAALALMLGGNADTASRTIAMFGEPGWSDGLETLKDDWFRAFGFWSDEDLKKGNLYRWVENAIAISHVKVNDVPQDWAVARLQQQFDNTRFDNGPHSETRVVIRYRLWQAAKSGDAAAKKGAILTLKFMKEKGVLMALRQEQGETGELAKKAFFELMNPKVFSKDDTARIDAERKALEKKGGLPKPE